MANIDQAKGFELIGYKNGQVNGSINPYYIKSTYATQLVVGDPVTKTGTSNATEVNQGSLYRIGTLPEINRTIVAVSSPLIGIIIGFEAIPDNADKGEYNPASTERVALVSDDPNALYRAQFDSATNVGIGGVGENFGYVYDETADIVNGNSGAEIDGSSSTTAATTSFKFERFEGSGTNDPGLTHSKGIFSINNHQGSPNTIGTV